ncbi:alpha/beta hydrolase [Paucibacter sp. DJ1R-11]|uniref:alpha/beta fold hydrolase n=1 Tax=Paucibacter sp. DJ1R-11 TaxID=2893556 RepID=UPI0021E516DD|nr:alpha/beta hydrolase [Paucibacter sp. DJ1R-11]MCV2362863.1 alpha/beta hydrolase [Paucibacter sp. DJ1R-11]
MQRESVQASSSDHVPIRSSTRLPTLVLLPGMDGTGDLFEPLIESLGADFKVLVVRYPEMQSLGYDDLVSYVGGLLPAKEPFVLLGESFSGPVAIKLAAASRPGLQGVILCCTFARNPRPALAWLRGLLPSVPFTWIPSTLLSWALLGSFAKGTLRSLLKEAVGRVSPSVMRARVRAVLEVDVTVELSQMRVPCLYLQASADRVVPARAATLIRSVLASVQLVRLDAPHCLLQGVPEKSADALASFVRRLGLTVS